MTEYGNYIVTAVGLFGFYLAGKKVWWAWYVNIANQILWFIYGTVTEQWGFVVGTVFYTAQFCRNAYLWTREEHPEWFPYRGRRRDEPKQIGRVTDVKEDASGISVRFFIDDEQFRESMVKATNRAEMLAASVYGPPPPKKKPWWKFWKRG